MTSVLTEWFGNKNPQLLKAGGTLAEIFLNEMALGLKMNFVFNNSKPDEEIWRLVSTYNFDSRNGFGLVMSGQDYYEIEDSGRLLFLIESELNLDLSLLDYWNSNTFEKEIDITKVHETLLQLKFEIEKNPDFYKRINYGLDIPETYLESKFLRDIEYLIKLIELCIRNGSTKIRYETD